MTKVKVKELYPFDLDLLVEKAENDDYWDKCLSFYSQVVKSLSSKQIEWLDKIEEKLE